MDCPVAAASFRDNLLFGRRELITGNAQSEPELKRLVAGGTLSLWTMAAAALHSAAGITGMAPEDGEYWTTSDSMTDMQYLMASCAQWRSCH